MDPGHELIEAEGLGDVVVSPGREPSHLVLGAVACGEEQHRRPVPLFPHAPAHLGAIHVGKHHVQEHQVVVTPFGHGDGVTAGGGGLHGEALEPQRRSQRGR